MIFEKSESSRSKADSFEQRKTEMLDLRRGILGVDGRVGKGEVRPVYRQWEEKQTLLRCMWESRPAGLCQQELNRRMNSDYLGQDIREW